MTRRSFENKLVKKIDLRNQIFHHQKKDFISDVRQHYFFFVGNKNGSKYRIIMRFHRSYFLEFDLGLFISCDQINQLVKKINPEMVIKEYYAGLALPETESYSVFSINLNTFINPENKPMRRTFRWASNKSVDFVIKDEYEDVDIDGLADKINNTVFNPVTDEIIPKTDSIEKIDSVLNDIPELKIRGVEPPLLTAAAPVYRHYTMGVLTANYLDRKDKKELTENYKELISNWEIDLFGYTDLFNRALKYFGY
jgi:hypothetical protein